MSQKYNNPTDLWVQLKGDYKLKKGDIYISTDGLGYITELLSTGLEPRRIRAAFQYFLDDRSKGDEHGYNMKRFFNNTNFYLDRVREGEGSKPRKIDCGPEGSAFYQCEGCGREVALLSKTDDDRNPMHLETRCPGESINGTFWTKEQWENFRAMGCGGRFVHQGEIWGLRAEQPVGALAVRTAVAEAAASMSPIDGDQVEFFPEGEQG